MLARTIDERFERFERLPWRYLFACEGCLSVVAIDRGELDSAGRTESGAPRIAVAGTSVARLIESLARASAEGELGAAVDRALESPESMLLRVPEVFAVARSAWGARVVLRSDAAFVSVDPVQQKPIAPEGRISLAAFEADEDAKPLQSVRAGEIVVHDDGRIVFRRGLSLGVIGVEGTSFLLSPVLNASGLPFSRVEAFLAPPDLLAREGNQP